jgi:hypothetical protein
VTFFERASASNVAAWLVLHGGEGNQPHDIGDLHLSLYPLTECERSQNGRRKFTLSRLRELEAEAVHISRETTGQFERPIFYSIGKDQSVMAHLSRKGILPPFALHGKRSPIIGRIPPLAFPHRSLSRPQGGRRPLVALNHGFIKRLHEDRGGPIVNLPQAREYSVCAGIKEPAGESDQTLTLDLLS